MATKEQTKISKEVLFDLHRRMVRIRLLEEAAGQLASEARIPGFIHLYVGEEAVAAGGCVALKEEDQISSTHRGHGHLVAKGGEFKPMMAEFMGKATGYCKGKGGSMHISDLDLGMLGANGIVGAGVPIAVGAAFANKYKNNGLVTMAFFGDGSTNIGAFHEAANMACALHLPIVFMCENNEYAEYTARERVMAITDVADARAALAEAQASLDKHEAYLADKTSEVETLEAQYCQNTAPASAEQQQEIFLPEGIFEPTQEDMESIPGLSLIHI